MIVNYSTNVVGIPSGQSFGSFFRFASKWVGVHPIHHGFTFKILDFLSVVLFFYSLFNVRTEYSWVVRQFIEPLDHLIVETGDTPPGM